MTQHYPSTRTRRLGSLASPVIILVWVVASLSRPELAGRSLLQALSLLAGAVLALIVVWLLRYGFAVYDWDDERLVGHGLGGRVELRWSQVDHCRSVVPTNGGVACELFDAAGRRLAVWLEGRDAQPLAAALWLRLQPLVAAALDGVRREGRRLARQPGWLRRGVLGVLWMTALVTIVDPAMLLGHFGLGALALLGTAVTFLAMLAWTCHGHYEVDAAQITEVRLGRRCSLAWSAIERVELRHRRLPGVTLIAGPRRVMVPAGAEDYLLLAAWIVDRVHDADWTNPEPPGPTNALEYHWRLIFDGPTATWPPVTAPNQEQRRPVRVGQRRGWLAVIIFLASLAWGFSVAQRQTDRHVFSTGVPATATIAQVERGAGNVQWVRYTYHYLAAKFQTRRRWPTGMGGVQTGQTVVVRVDPDAPQHSRFDGEPVPAGESIEPWRVMMGGLLISLVLVVPTLLRGWLRGGRR